MGLLVEGLSVGLVIGLDETFCTIVVGREVGCLEGCRDGERLGWLVG